MLQTTMSNLNPTTPLERSVADWYESECEDGYTSAISDLMQNGCVSGMVGHLIYYSDTTAFYRQHKREIWQLLDQMLDECGLERTQDLLSDWDGGDRWAEDTHNQNLLAWFAFEVTAQNLANSAGMDT